jgi:N-acetylglucosaminyldiphosphoundecaprenol N-acetyl-beta-D-mannosaminyltransferase
MNSASVPCLTDAPERHELISVPPAPSTSVAMTGWPIALFGVPFDHVTVRQTLARFDAMIASRQPHYVVTANVDFVVQAHRDVELRRILLEADLVLCDGTPLLWASRWFGNPLPERVAGSDLAPALIRHAADHGHSIFLLGAGPGVAAEAAAKLQREHPSLVIAGHYAPPFSSLLEMDHAEIARRIRAARPDILLVSFGCPKQEKWIAMHYRSLGVPVAIGVGATIDFLAGRVKRAPAWMRRSGTEWIYRLLQEPQRLYKRYANDLFVFLPTLARQWRRLRARATVECDPPRPAVTAATEWCHLDAGESLTFATLRRDAEFWRALPQRAGHCLLDVSGIREVDATGIAFLVRWRRLLQARGRQLVLLAPSAPLHGALRTLRLADYFPMAEDAAEALRHTEAAATQLPVLHDGGARSLAWCGDIIAANVEDVWQMTTNHVQRFVEQQTRLVIIDLTRLRFIDSAGAGLMLRIKKWAQQFPAEVLFTHAQPNVRNVLRLTRLDQLLLEGAQ